MRRHDVRWDLRHPLVFPSPSEEWQLQTRKNKWRKKKLQGRLLSNLCLKSVSFAPPPSQQITFPTSPGPLLLWLQQAGKLDPRTYQDNINFECRFDKQDFLSLSMAK